LTIAVIQVAHPVPDDLDLVGRLELGAELTGFVKTPAHVLFRLPSPAADDDEPLRPLDRGRDRRLVIIAALEARMIDEHFKLGRQRRQRLRQRVRDFIVLVVVGYENANGCHC
jgi:hypothetical protein